MGALTGPTGLAVVASRVRDHERRLGELDTWAGALAQRQRALGQVVAGLARLAIEDADEPRRVAIDEILAPLISE